jgi:hypothetical protein
MTTGSWNRSISPWREWTRTWTGADRPAPKKDPKWPKPVWRTIRYADGTKLRFREARQGVTRPPKRARQEAEHNYYFNEVKRIYPGVTYKIVGDPKEYWDWSYWFFPVPSPNPPFFTFSANDQLKLLGKLREKIAGSDFNMSVFLGESHQTVQMIGDTAIRIAKAYHHLRKGDFAGTARSLLEGTSRAPLKPYRNMKKFKPTSERMSAHWLELQYGWRPLLDDVEGAAQAVAHRLSVPAAQTYRMSRRIENTTTNTDNHNLVGGRVQSSLTTVQRRSLKVKISEYPSTVQLLGLTHPELVAWELVPWSFVADWFIPIGAYLEARAITSIVKTTSVLTSDFSETEQRVVSWGGARPDNDQFLVTQRTLNRYVGTDLTVPLPQFKSLAKVASWEHCANAVALLTQQFAGKR